VRLSEDLRYLLPALLLAGTAIAVLLMDIMPRRGGQDDDASTREARRTRGFWWLSVCGTLLTMVAILWLSVPVFQLDDSTSHRVLGMMVFDPLAGYGWLLLDGALLFLLGMGRSYVAHRIAEPGLFYAMMLLFGAAAFLLVAATNTIMLLLTLDFVSCAQVSGLWGGALCCHGAGACLVVWHDWIH